MGIENFSTEEAPENTKKNEPLKALNRSLSKEEDKIRLKPIESKRKSIENINGAQKEILKLKPVTKDTSESEKSESMKNQSDIVNKPPLEETESKTTSTKVKIIKKKKKKINVDSDVINFESLAKSEHETIGEKTKDETATSSYTVEEPTSPVEKEHHKPSVQNLEPVDVTDSHYERVTETKPSIIEQPFDDESVQTKETYKSKNEIEREIPIKIEKQEEAAV